jgi:hypothetical protein
LFWLLVVSPFLYCVRMTHDGAVIWPALHPSAACQNRFWATL